jgi:hypothetical protein
MRSQMNRRRFIRNTALSGAGLLILKSGIPLRSYAANEKVQVGLIGVNGRGDWFVRAIPGIGADVVALCDVNDRRAQGAFSRHPSARRFHDFRKMLEEMDKKMEAVIIAAPDHIHAVASMAAIKAGKHVYCEKPLTHNVRESRLLREAALKHKVATQMGNQGTASEAFRRCVELVQAGVLGDVPEVHIWNTGGGHGHRKRPSGDLPVPDYLQWDLWLGPAAYRPFDPEWLNWHGWREFGTGVVGNWACHTMNLAFKALKIDSLWYPKSPQAAKKTIRLQAKVSEIDTESFPRSAVIRYEIPEREGLPPLTLNWSNGGREELDKEGIRTRVEALLGRPLDWSSEDDPIWKDWSGILLLGSKGMIHSNAHNTEFSLLPEDKFKNFEGPPRTLPRSRGHEREWLDACRGASPGMSNFNYAGPLAEFVLLGNVATQFTDPIEYDPVNMKVTNNEKADAALRRDYRKGWEL